MILAAVSCQKVSTESGQPMSFGTDTEDVHYWTKATDGLYSNTQHTSMLVWGTLVSGSNSTVMDGYQVNYNTTENSWDYDNIAGQELQYWDSYASSYRFHAGCPQEKSSITANTLTLSLSATDDISGTVLYSSPKVVEQASFGDNVLMSFNQANARIKLGFESNEQVTIENIKLTPSTSYASSADMTLNYDWSTPAVTPSFPLSNRTGRSTALAFNDVAIPAGQTGTDFSSTVWYMIPETNDVNEHSAAEWTISIDVNDGVSTVNMTKTFEQLKGWCPGHSYSYVFSINGWKIGDITVEDWDVRNYHVDTEQMSAAVAVSDTLRWTQPSTLLINTFEFIPLYNENSSTVLWGGCNLSAISYFDSSPSQTWSQVSPADNNDTDYLASYYGGITDINWETPSRADFTALLNGSNTVVRMGRDDGSGMYGIWVYNTSETKSIFLPQTNPPVLDSNNTASVTKTTYSGNYWTRDEFDSTHAYKLHFEFSQTVTRDGSGNETASPFTGELAVTSTGSALYDFVSVEKTTYMATKALVKMN